MTTRVKNLNRYQKGVLLLLAGMTLLFTALYLAATARKGFAYQNAILTPVQVGRETVYSGKIQGEPARFTVYADRTVLFQYGGQTYGPYTAREAPSAVPKTSELAGQMTGVELSCGGQLLFRGGVLDLGGRRLLYNTDGTIADAGVTVTVIYGNQGAVVMDENGTVIDPMEPSVLTILDLMAGPELRHKGAWPLWAAGVLVCALTAASILFADEWFRLPLLDGAARPRPGAFHRRAAVSIPRRRRRRCAGQKSEQRKTGLHLQRCWHCQKVHQMVPHHCRRRRHTRADRHGILRFQCRLCLVRFRGWAGCFCGKRIQDILTEIGQEIETDS